MVDYLGDLQPAGDDVLGLRSTLEAWDSDKEEEEATRSRRSPSERPFSSLEEIDDDSSIDTTAPSRYTHSPVCISGEYVEHSNLVYDTIPDPVRLRGVGGTTMFGLNNHFEDDFPSHLMGKV